MLEADDHGGGRGRGMNGTHRSHGIWIAEDRPGVTPTVAPARLSAVAPWLAEAMGLAWQHDAAGGEAEAPLPQDYDADEEDMVAERLRALGYLE